MTSKTGNFLEILQIICFFAALFAIFMLKPESEILYH